MATLFTHVFAASFFVKSFEAQQTKRFWILIAVCSILPDADVLSFAFGIPYSHFWGHRGFSHSLIFAAILAVFFTLVFFREKSFLWMRSLKICFCFFVATASHGVLDALTNGGLGVAFFSPFENSRYFFPWRPILVSPIGHHFFSARGLNVILNEILWVWLPILSFCFLSFQIQKRCKKK